MYHSSQKCVCMVWILDNSTACEHLLFICVEKSHPSGIKLFWFESLALGLCRTNNNGTCSLGPAGA